MTRDYSSKAEIRLMLAREGVYKSLIELCSKLSIEQNRQVRPGEIIKNILDEYFNNSSWRTK